MVVFPKGETNHGTKTAKILQARLPEGHNTSVHSKMFVPFSFHLISILALVRQILFFNVPKKISATALPQQWRSVRKTDPHRRGN
jgi:hypothetical protein